MIWILVPVLWVAALATAPADGARPPDRVVVRYWEKWTGFEADAMRTVVEDFNASQDRIFVDYTSVSQITRRLMLAIAGGVPPDIAGIWEYDLPVYAENNALTPLDRMAREAGITGEDYLPVVWQLCRFRGHLWALPSTPSSTALIYNKRMFREAGLDPDRPPQTIAELEAMNERILRTGPGGRIQKIGHLPEEPGWWNSLWGTWFGGPLVDGEQILANSPENLAAYRWVQSYPERFGAANLVAMRDGFGTFASPQNAFFSGRVAMILQGVWIHNFIKNYAPADFEWGVAAFPGVRPGEQISIINTDLLVIPHGAKHPREAFEFMAYVNSQPVMEKLCLGQKKFSPLRRCSPEFFDRHPNPQIRKFVELATGPGARPPPQVSTWNELAAGMKNAVSKIWSGSSDAASALEEVQIRQQRALDRRTARWKAVGPLLEEQWSNK